MDVPDMVANAVSEVWPADRTELPGAETCGFWMPELAGPRLLKEAMASVLVVAPTAMTSAAESAGEPVVRQFGPEFAAAKTGITPAACQARMTASYLKITKVRNFVRMVR